MVRLIILLVSITALPTYGKGTTYEPAQSEHYTQFSSSPYGSQDLTFTIDNATHSTSYWTNSSDESINIVLKKQEQLAEAIELINDSNRMDYAIWASILLACVTIIITILSVILAIVSIVGYKNFKKSIEQTVQNISSTVAKDEATKQIDAVAKKELVRLIDEGALNKHLESTVDMILRIRTKPNNDSSGFKKYPELDAEDSNNE